MTDYCNQLTVRILDTPAGAIPDFSAQEAAHLRACAECRSAWEARQALGGIFETLGRAAQSRGAALDPALKQRTLARLREELRDEAQAAAAQRPANIAEVSLGWWERYAARFAGAGSHWTLRWGMGVAVLMFLLVGGVRTWVQAQPVGKIRFAQAAMRLDGRNWTGEEALTQGAEVRTSPTGGAILSLGDNGVIRVAMANDTEIRLMGPRQFRLLRGRAWLDVEPGGAGYRILAGPATVTVLGTVYGVDFIDDRVQVNVARGRVQVAGQGSGTAVAAGQTVELGQQLGAVEARAEGLADPAWVTALREAELKAQAGQYLPSVTVKHPQPAAR